MWTAIVYSTPWRVFIGQLFRQIRIVHWIKHLLIFLPAFFAGQIFHLHASGYWHLAITFSGFCCLSSAVYCLNDVVDIHKDRLHATKRLRPLASGYFTSKQTLLAGLPFLLAGAACISSVPWQAGGVLCAYMALNVLYCFWLKKIAVIDVSCISTGIVLRLAAGGLVTGVRLSHWIIIITFLLAFSVALAKRRDDLVLSEGGDVTFRSAQAGYNKQFIDTAKGISLAVTLVAYILYTVSPEVMVRLGSQHVYVTALPVFLGIMRYLQLSIVQEKTGDPVLLLLRDPFLLLMVLAWAAIFYYLIYV